MVREGDGPKNGPVVVLFSVPAPSGTTNPYIPLLAGAVEGEDAKVHYFSWKWALTHRVDVFHVHWPELMIRHRSKAKTAMRAMAGLVLLQRMRLDRTSIVWTVHNLRPHETGGYLERLFLKKFYDRVDHRIYINESAENVEEPSTTILHGTYRDWYAGESARAERRTGLLFFGLVRPYKGLEGLLTAFQGLGDADVTLTVAGSPNSGDYAQAVRRHAGGRASITLLLEYVDDDRLAGLIRSAAVVVLPYTQMYNSGALLLALSLGSHVLAPRTPSTTELQKEFGSAWVTLFEGSVTAVDLRRALHEAEGRDPLSLPDMTRRDWPDIGRSHVDLYRSLRGRSALPPAGL
jgi:beta-1,4-mannosyltransferase